MYIYVYIKRLYFDSFDIEIKNTVYINISLGFYLIIVSTLLTWVKVYSMCIMLIISTVSTCTCTN